MGRWPDTRYEVDGNTVQPRIKKFTYTGNRSQNGYGNITCVPNLDSRYPELYPKSRGQAFAGRSYLRDRQADLTDGRQIQADPVPAKAFLVLETVGLQGVLEHVIHGMALIAVNIAMALINMVDALRLFLLTIVL